jgi:aconitase B
MGAMVTLSHKVSKGVAFSADLGTVAFAFTSETFNANSDS